MKTKLFAFVLVVCVIFSATLPVSAATPIYKEDIDITNLDMTLADTGGMQPNGLYDYAWLVDSVTVSSNGYGSWRTGPTGVGPGSLSINDSTTISRTFTNTISGSYSIGKGTIASTLGVSIGVAETHGTSYTITLPAGTRRTIIFRPKTQTKKIVTGYYRIPTGVIGGTPVKLKSETCYVTSFVSWDYSWKSGR